MQLTLMNIFRIPLIMNNREIMFKTYTYEELKTMRFKPIMQMSPSISGVKDAVLSCFQIMISHLRLKHIMVII